MCVDTYIKATWKFVSFKEGDRKKIDDNKAVDLKMAVYEREKGDDEKGVSFLNRRLAATALL